MKTRFALAVAAFVASATFAPAQSFTNLTPGTINPFAFTGGTGSFVDPYVLDETFLSDQGAYIGVQNFTNGWIRKDVTNSTGANMTSFEVEIGFGWGYGHTGPFTGSDDFDGYSFAQGTAGRVVNSVPYGPGIIGENGTFSSTKFGYLFIDETTNTRDFIQYFGGTPGVVLPGESASFMFRVTTPGGPFVLRQQCNVAIIPEPATMLVLGAGLAALAARRRIAKKA